MYIENKALAGRADCAGKLEEALATLLGGEAAEAPAPAAPEAGEPCFGVQRRKVAPVMRAMRKSLTGVLSLGLFATATMAARGRRSTQKRMVSKRPRNLCAGFGTPRSGPSASLEMGEALPAASRSGPSASPEMGEALPAAPRSGPSASLETGEAPLAASRSGPPCVCRAGSGGGASLRCVCL